LKTNFTIINRRYGENVPLALQQIEKEKRFHYPVVGPIGIL